VKKIYASRASVVIYNFINSQQFLKPFILPANICPIVPAVFLKANKKMFFFDIEKDNFQMNKDNLLNVIRKYPKRFSGMLWMNGYGSEECNEDFFDKIKKINDNFYIIDDRCLQKPLIKLRKSNADLVVFSTGYSKYVDLGSGGYGFIQKELKYRKSDLIFNENDYNKIINKFHRSINNKVPIKYNLNNWLGEETGITSNIKNYNNKIKMKLQASERHKNIINSVYEKNINSSCKVPPEFCQWRYNILVNKKDLLLKNIFKNGLFASSHYYPSNLIFGHSNCKNSMYISNFVINLFNDQRYSKKQAIKTCELINSHIKKYGVPNIL